jgi:hypothetical protein
MTRVRDCTVQGTVSGGTAGIVLATDSTGSDCGGTLIEGCWFELNATAHIVGQGHQATVVRSNTFWPTQPSGSGAGGPILPTAYSLTHAGPTYMDGPNNVTSLSK